MILVSSSQCSTLLKMPLITDLLSFPQLDYELQESRGSCLYVFWCPSTWSTCDAL